MELTKAIIQEAMDKSKKQVISFSGGGDSMVLVDIITNMGYRPELVYADSQMEYPETLPFIREVAAAYGLKLNVARGSRTPYEQWMRQGWPMLGKMAARIWMQKNKDKDFKCDVSSCCRAMKIAPARNMTKYLGADLQFTGQRGSQDDMLRGLRAFKDGAIKYVKADKILVCSPLIGWTDTMIRRYTKQNKLPVHPAKKRGAQTIGCMYCGGGAQYDNSGYRILRTSNPEEWWRFMVTWRGGEIVLALKYDVTQAAARQAIKQLGGLETLAKERPWVFDFLRLNPLAGYDRGTRPINE